MDVRERDLATGVDGGSNETGIEREIALWPSDDFGVGPRAETNRAAGRVVEIERTRVHLHHRAGVAGERVEKFLQLEFGDQRLARGDQRFELTRLFTQVRELPEALHDARGFVRELLQ